MAPRMPESPDEYFRRLRQAAAKGERVVPFGKHHWSHVVCHEDNRWVLRRWTLNLQTAEAYRVAHNGFFMPESAEECSEPGPEVLLDAGSLDEIIAKLRKSWPVA